LNQSQQEQLKSIGESQSLNLRTAQNSASVPESVHEATRGIHSQVADTATAVTSLNADMRNFIEIAQQSHVTPYMVAEVERAMEKMLQKHSFRSQETPPAENTSCISVRVAERSTPGQELNAALRGSHYHSKQELVCQNPLLTISRTTSTAKVQLAQSEDTDGTENSKGSSYDSITTYEVRVNLGLWRRGWRAVIAHTRSAYMPGRDFRLRTHNIVEDDAPVFQAAREFDIETVRALFLSGKASLFDQNSQGISLFDQAGDELCSTMGLDKAVRGLNFLKFILDHGGSNFAIDSTKIAARLLSLSVWVSLDVGQVLTDALRLMSEASPNNTISTFLIAMRLTLKSERTPVGEFVRQQDHWFLDLEPGPAIKETNQQELYIYETDRQIYEDEEGLQLAPLLLEPFRYSAQPPNLYSFWGISSILAMYKDSEFKQIIRSGCRNRIEILLRAGEDPRGHESCPLNEAFWLRMSVTQCAILTETCEIWQEALEHFGWSQSEIDDLFEEEMYLGLPELLNGDLKFKGRAENREEFLQTLAIGGYQGEDSLILAEELAIYIDMHRYNIEKTIDEARQAFKMKSTPGSWQEDEVSTLIFGVDFFLWYEMWNKKRRVYNWECFASFEEYDRYRENYWWR